MHWTPLMVGLTLAYFLVASITTFDMRLTQAKRQGLDEPDLPQWIAWLYWLLWIIWLVLLWLNWKYALVLFALKFVLGVMPVLEIVGNILMSPFKPRQH